VQGVPTVESVAQALHEMGPITTSQLSLLQEHLDVGRIGDEGKKLLKQRMLQVRAHCSAGVTPGRGLGDTPHVR
jgi:hypothetical protein